MATLKVKKKDEENKPTPRQMLESGGEFKDGRRMKSDDLTKGDCIFFIQHGIGRYDIRRKYRFYTVEQSRALTRLYQECKYDIACDVILSTCDTTQSISDAVERIKNERNLDKVYYYKGKIVRRICGNCVYYSADCPRNAYCAACGDDNARLLWEPSKFDSAERAKNGKKTQNAR